MIAALEMSIQEYYLSVVGDIYISVIVLLSLSSVQLFSVFDVFILRMPKHGVGHPQGLGQQAGVFDRTVVFFIWFEDIFFIIKAKIFSCKTVY